MAYARQCDRCKSFYTSQNYENAIKIKGDYIGGISLLTIGSNKILDLDLCPDCSRELMKFLKQEGCD